MNEPKRTWIQPKLVVHGDVAKITQQINKTYGLTDGYTFNGVPISNAS